MKGLGIFLGCVVGLASAWVCASPHAETLAELIESAPLEQNAVFAQVKSGLSEEERARYFGQFVINSLNVNTPKTVRRHHLQALALFGDPLQKDAKFYIDRKIKMGEEEGRMSFWIPESRDLPVVRMREKGIYSVSEKGHMNSVVAGLRNEVGLKIDLELKAVSATSANPYGFVVTKYYERLEAVAPPRK